MSAALTRRFSGTAIPARRASSSMTNSFSGMAAKRAEGSLTIHDPPMPPAGMVRPPDASITAENFTSTPQRRIPSRCDHR